MGSSIGRKIRNLRLSHNLTQEQLGTILGVNKSAVQKYESGDVKNLKRETIKRLCNHFRAYPYDFIFEPGEYWLDKEFGDLISIELQEQLQLSDCDNNEFMNFFTRKFELNDIGYQKVLNYMDDLAQIEKYKRRH